MPQGTPQFHRFGPEIILQAANGNDEDNDEDYDVLADGAVVGRMFKANAAPVGSPSMWRLAFGKWTLAFGNHDRTPTPRL
jgi:hypothetical protein